MNGSSRPRATSLPIATAIAAQMRMATPKVAQPQVRGPVNVKAAIKQAANSSPVAKAAFKRAAPAVKAATPHLQALAKQPGKNKLASLYHGVAALHSLRKVTREMGKVTREMNKAGLTTMTSARDAFHATAAESPAAKAAFTRAGPATERAQKHLDALVKLQQQPKSGLLSSLGHGFQAMRALRGVTKELRKEPASPMSARYALDEARKSPEVARAFDRAQPSVTQATPHLKALARDQQQAKPSLLSSLGHGFQALRALRGVTREMVRASQDDAVPSQPSPQQRLQPQPQPQPQSVELSEMPSNRQAPTRRRALSAPPRLGGHGVRRDDGIKEA